MIRIFNKPLLALFCLLMSIGILTSCKKNNDVAASGATQLLSFGPTGAMIGDTLSFIGHNLNIVTEIDFTGKGAIVPQASFLQQTSELIKLVVPKSTEQGFVTLKTPQGDIVTKTKLNLNVAAVVTSMTLQARPGDNITINGNYLNWVTRVTFGKDKAVDSFVSKTINQLVVTVPMDAQTGPLIISYAGTKPLDVQTTDTLKVSLPAITGISPIPVRHAGNLTITGTNLDLAKQVMFTGDTTHIKTFVSQTATQLVVKVPASTTKGKVTLIAASGVTVLSTQDVDVVLPSISAITPNPVDSLTNVTITGTNLDVISSISFIGVSAAVKSFVSQTPTQIIVQVPKSAISGKLTFTVANSTLSVKSTNDLQINGSSVTPIIIYDDAITPAWNGWIGGGWGGAKDLNNTSPVKSGAKSIKIDYASGGYGVPLQLGGANISLAGYKNLKLSVYGGTGSSGKSVNIGFNEADGTTITIVEGKWTDFVIPLSQISSVSTLTHLYLKNYSSTGDFTIYVDDMGIY